MRVLTELAEAVEGASWVRPPEPDARIREIRIDSRETRAGDLFVAIAGTRVDGHEHVGDAVARGAAAVVAERELEDPGVPVLQVPSSRRALAALAAAWYGRPAERIPLVGITGTLGKTSVLALLEAILERAGKRVGSIGSLGVRFGGVNEETGHTVPPPLGLQRGLARMVDGGADVAVMEVTTHAISQDRVHGLRFSLGVFTNLVPMEHMEYHGTFDDYVAVKTRYFEFLRPDAPLVYSSGDRAVSALVEERGLRGLSCGGDEGATVQVVRESVSAEGSEIRLRVRRPLPILGGGEVLPVEIPLRLKLLGRPNINNAALAATAALCLGAEAEAIRDALGAFPPPRRRMEIVHRGRITVIDDTVGHPDSITACLEVVEQLRYRRLHIVFAVRGQRGDVINRQTADTLAIWAARVRPDTLIITASNGEAPERRLVSDAEREAFLGGLREQGIGFEQRERLDDAVNLALERVADGDLLLLLGTAGMDEGAAIVRRWLDTEAAPAR